MKKTKPAMKKPSSTPKASSIGKGPKVGKHDWQNNPVAVAIFKRPASHVRPHFSKKPTQHAGGRIYFHKTARKFRVYLRKNDKIEEKVPLLDDEKKSFVYACALIEADTRPSHA